MNDLTEIKSLKDTQDLNEVNFYLSKGGVLLSVAAGQKENKDAYLLYCIGFRVRLEDQPKMREVVVRAPTPEAIQTPQPVPIPQAVPSPQQSRPPPQAVPRPRTDPTPRVVSPPRSVPIPKAVSTPQPVPRPRVVPQLNISKGADDLGPMDIVTIKSLVEKGEITLNDHFFDANVNEWVPLKVHPEFC